MAEEVEMLIERLRTKARQASEISKSMADAKSIRNGGQPGDYMWQEPEQTVEWKAADMLAALTPSPDRQAERDKALGLEWEMDVRPIIARALERADQTSDSFDYIINSAIEELRALIGKAPQ
jgi:hypothetical protein